MLVETFEEGDHITRYVDMGPGAPHNAKLAQLGSGAMLQVGFLPELKGYRATNAGFGFGFKGL